MNDQPNLFASPVTGPKFEMRPYQQEAVDTSIKAFGEGVRRQIVHAATGTGKTVLFTELIDKLPPPRPEATRVLIMAHRDELIQQTVEAVLQSNPNLRVGVEQGSSSASDSDDVIVASVATLGRKDPNHSEGYGRRLRLLQPKQFRLLVIDEVHHSLASTYQRVLDYFDTASPDSDLLLWGCTATPNRSDGKGLGKLFDEIVHSYGLVPAIEDKYLSPIKAMKVSTDTSLEGVRTQAGDWAAGQLSDRVNNEDRNVQIVKAWYDHCKGFRHSTIGFCASVEHIYSLRDCFRDNGVDARGLDGTTGRDLRREMIQGFRNREFPVLLNAMVLCLDAETEILTSDGWTGIDDMTYGHKVANWDTDGSMFFDEPKFIVRRDRKEGERMVVLETRSRSIRVTEDHRMVYKPYENRDFGIVHAGDLAGQPGILPVCGHAEPVVFDDIEQPYEFSEEERTQKIYESRHYLHYNKGLPLADAETAAIEKMEYREGGLRRKHPHELTLAECEFIGFFVGDGTVTNLQSGGIEYKVNQSFKYDGIISWFDSVIAKVGLHCARRENHTKPNEVIYNGSHSISWSFSRGTGSGSQEVEGVFPIEHFLDKSGSKYLWGLNEPQFDAFIRGLWFANGNHGKAIPSDDPGSRPSGDRKKSMQICSANGELLRAVQAVATCRGWRVNMSSLEAPGKPGFNPSTMHYITLNQNQETHMMAASHALQFEDGWKSERVWCVTSTTGNIVTRRNGTVTVTGNTEGSNIPAIDAMLMCRPTKSPLLFTQVVGRGTRLFEGKSDCLVIDFVDACAGKSLMTVPSLFGMDADFDAEGEDIVQVQRQVEELFEENPSVIKATSLVDAQKMVSEHVDLLSSGVEDDVISEASRFMWRKVGDSYILRMKDDRVMTIGQDAIGKHLITLHSGGESKIVRTRPDLMGAISAADNYIADRFPDAPVLLSRDAVWRTHPMSPGQVTLFGKLRMQIPRGRDGAITMTKGEASDLIDKKFLSMKRGKAKKEKKSAIKGGVKTKVDNVKVGKL